MGRTLPAPDALRTSQDPATALESGRRGKLRSSWPAAGGEGILPGLTPLRLEQFVLAGEPRRATHQLLAGSPVLIGRSEDAGVRLEDESVSRRHCQVECLPNGPAGSPAWWIRDLGSLLGVTVNDAPVVDPTRIRPGDLIRVGRSELVVEQGLGGPHCACAGCGRTTAEGAPEPGLAHGRRWVCGACLVGASRPNVWRVGEWVEIAEIGQGSYGRVLLAAWRGMRLGALKLSKPAPFSDPDEAREADARFRREADVLRRIDHPAVLRMYEAHGSPQLRWSALELGDEDLTALVERQGPAAPWQAALAGAAMLEGLAHIHALGVLHRDLKPLNVIVAVDGSIRLGDFGLCIARGATRVTASRLGLGTLHYVSPEQLDDAHEVDARTDIYGWGATMYYLLTGLAPHHEARGYTEMVQALREPPIRPDQLDPRIPASLVDVVMQALAPDPARRFGSAREALESLTASHAR